MTTYKVTTPRDTAIVTVPNANDYRKALAELLRKARAYPGATVRRVKQ